MQTPDDEHQKVKALIIAAWLVMLIVCACSTFILNGCSMTFQNVNARGDAIDLSDETTQPTTDIPLTIPRI